MLAGQMDEHFVLLRAKILNKRKDFELALHDASQGIKLNSENWVGYDEAVVSQIGMGKFDEALVTVLTGLQTVIDPYKLLLRLRLLLTFEPLRQDLIGKRTFFIDSFYMPSFSPQILFHICFHIFSTNNLNQRSLKGNLTQMR